MAFTNRKSIHGRQLALSSTGGIISSAKLSGTHNSTTYDMAAQMWGAAMVTNITSTGGATLTNAGVDTIATTATAATFLIAAPVAGVSKEIYVTSSASTSTHAMSLVKWGPASAMWRPSSTVPGAVMCTTLPSYPPRISVPSLPVSTTGTSMTMFSR